MKEDKSQKKTGAVKKSNGQEDKDFLCVGLGASAGGVKALREFFATMPPNSGMAFVVVLHLSPQHESNLPAILQSQTAMPVVQVNEAQTVEPDHVYVIPPNKNLEMADGTVRVSEPQEKRGPRVAVDVFFRTLAEGYGRNAVCIVLSGTGADGTLGLKRVKESNGFAIVQDPEDAEYDGMPRSAIATNLADWVLPVRRMPEKLIHFRESSERLHLTDGDAAKVAEEINAEESLREILTILRVRTGHDFSNYKTPTIVRRIARHLQIHELEDIPSYLKFLRGNQEEILSLQRNLLINVTNFFRDREAFARLALEVVPQLFADKSPHQTVRVWTAGCASGEEAYSVAMLLQEYSEKLSSPPKFQVFATDVDEEAVEQARENLYPETIEADVSAERLKRFFVKEGSRYRVKKELRETVLFAPHNVLRDPPFSRLDLVTCRNLLIYLQREAQQQVLDVFHFALAPNGFLFLGSAESAESVPELFSVADKKYRIYRRRPAPRADFIPRLPEAGRWEPQLSDGKRRNEPSKAFALGEVHYKLLESIAPPSALVDDKFEIVYMSESIGRFMRFKGGEPSQNILKLVHPDLLHDLRAALFAAQRDREISRFENVRVALDGGETIVSLIVRPAEVESDRGDFLLVIIDDGKTLRFSVVDNDEQPQTKPAPPDKGVAMESVVSRLEDELTRTRAHLRSTVEQHEVTVEELKASNEELQAINEELRSAGEELETSKEEAQSVNEELTTVNSELKEKIDESSRINADLQNLIASTDIATIFLDRNLRIKRFTPRVQEFFSLTPADAGRPLKHFTHRLDYADMETDAAHVLETLKTTEREVSDGDGRFFLTRFAPYRTFDDRIDGVVLNFINITERKLAESRLRESEEHFRAFVTASSDAVFSLNPDWSEVRFLDGKDFVADAENPGETWVEKYIPAEDRPKVIAEISEAVSAKRIFEAEHRVIRTDGSIAWALSRVIPLLDERGDIKGWFGTTRDITERKDRDERLRKSEDELKLILESTKEYAIITFDPEGIITRWNEGARRIFGYTEAEAVGTMTHTIFTPEDRQAGAPEQELATARKNGRAEDERWHMRKDGSRFYASGVMQLLKGGATQGFVKICRDQTDKLTAAEARREKQVLQQLVSMQEDERRRIARDIHDHLGQQLTALRLKLESAKKICSDQKVCDEIEETQTVAEQLDRDVDFLAWELRPASLDDLGLRVTLHNFVKEWSNYSGIKVEFHASGLAKRRLVFEIETNLYRIAQEALNNIYKHAKAENVSVLLEKRDDQVRLIVEDDGVGFNPKGKKNRIKGLGLNGMSERAKICGGEMEIESAPKRGTTVFVRVPASFATTGGQSDD